MTIAALKIQFTDEEQEWILKRIGDCLSSGQISQGRNVTEFEEKFAAYAGVKHAVAVNSGSSAVEVMMRVLNVAGKEVLMPTNTFLATATGVLFAGGKVRLVDADLKTFSVGLDALKARLTKDTAGVIMVHIGGIINPEIEAIKEWCDEQGLWFFEDAAHAHGSNYNGKFAGTFGIAGSYSLFATKVITSGEGGLVVTNDDETAKMLRLYRNHGKPEPWITYNTHLGSNWRMSDITATLAISQLGRLDEIISRREDIAEQYNHLLSEQLPELEIITPKSRCSWYKYIVLLPPGVDREILKQKMKEEKGIGLQGEVYGVPIHKQPIAIEMGLGGEFPVADDICERHICLPIYPQLEDKDVEATVHGLASVLKEMNTK